MASIAKLVAELNLDGSGFDKGLGFARKSLGGFGKALAIAIPIAAITGIGVALFKVGDAYDAMSDSIAIKTGATGDALKALQGDAVDVFKTVPTTMQIAGDAIASISAKTGDTGKNLRDLTASEIELARVTGTDLNGNIDASTKLFNAFGVSAKNQTKTLDQIFTASQKSGVGVDQLMAEVQQFNPVLRAMGLGAGASANLIGKLDKSGLHTTVVMQGFKKSLGVFAKQGVSDVKAGLTDVFNGIKNAGTSADATAIAMKYFGAKAGPELAQAIRDGKISVDDLTGSVDKNGKSILDSAKGTYDFAENWTILKNNVEAALIPLGTMVFQGLNLLIPLLTDGVKAIGTFATAMGDAFGSSAKVSDLIKQFPDWLQPAAKALLLVADAAGDVARGFSTGGLAGAFDALGPAIKQALGALGSFALDITIDIGKWIIGKLPSLADWLDTLFGGGGATGSDSHGMDAADRGTGGLHHVTLSTLAVDILGFAAGKVADLWGWVKGLFGVGSTSVVGDGTGMETNTITLSDVAVSIAGWVIAKAADIGSDIVRFLAATAVKLASVAVSVGSWVISTAADLGPEIVRFLAATAVELKTFALSLGIPTIANATSDVNTWLQGWLDDHKDVNAAVTNWTLVFNDPTQVTLPDTGKAGSDAANQKSTIVLIKDWYLQVQGDPKMTPEQEAQTNASIGDFFGKLKTKVTLGQIVMDNPVGQFSLALNNLLSKDMPVLVKLTKWSVDLGSSDPVVSSSKASAGPAGWSLWLAGKVADKIGKLDVSLPSWHLSLPEPALPDWLKNGWSKLSKAVSTVEGLIDRLKKDIGIADKLTRGAFDPALSSQGGGAFGNHTYDPTTGIPDTNNNDPNAIPVAGLTNRIVIPAPDHGAFDKVLSDLGAQVKTFVTTTYTAKFDIDTGPAAIKYTDASTWGDVWSKQNFVALFSIDDGPAAVSYTDAFSWGTVWDAATFTSTFGIDNGPAAIAYTDAYGWGDTWDGAVFTARITVDTSALDAAEFVVATKMASIRALLPSSPAKKGPFRKLPTFAWLHDDLAGTLGRMETTAQGRMPGISNALYGVGGFGGGNGGSAVAGTSVTIQSGAFPITVVAQPGMDEEALADMVAAKLTRALQLARAS